MTGADNIFDNVPSNVLYVVYESLPHKEGDDEHGGFPLFSNSFSRRVGPPPRHPFALRSVRDDATVVLTVDGKVAHCDANFSAIVANRNIVSRGWGRWVPKGLDVAQDANKLWLLGRAEFAPTITAEERIHADDPWFDGDSVHRIYVPRGQTEAYLNWKHARS